MTERTKLVLAIVLFSLLLVAVADLIPTRELAIDLIVQIRDSGAMAPIIYVCIFVIAAIAGFSRTVLTIIAGVVFEPAVAIAVVIVSALISFLGTFMLARSFAADWVAARLDKIPSARKLMTAVEENGFRMLMLMRLNPFVPGIVNGYGFGLTSIKLPAYLIASMLGSLPLTLIYVYLGWAGGATMLRPSGEASSLQQGTLLLGAGLSILMLIAITMYGRKTIAAVSNDAAQKDNKQ